MKTSISRAIFVSLLFVLFYTICTPAQIVPPGNVDPGAIDKANLNKFNFQEKRSLPEDNTRIEDLNKNNSRTPAVMRTSKFLVKKITFSGNKICKTEELEKISSIIVGKESTIDEVIEITNKITEMYKKRGYLTSLAYILPQKIENGNLEIAILEGKVGNIKIQGNRWVKTTYIKNNILKNNDFDKQKIFNVNNLKQSLGEINKNEYLKGQVTLQKGVEPETTDIILQIKDRFPIGLSTSWDNGGRDLIGTQKAGITLTNYNLTGFGDTIYANTSLASGSLGLSTGYSLPVGDKGTELRLGYSLSKIHLGGSYKQYDIHGSSYNFSPTIFQPVYRGRSLNISSDLSFDMRQSKTTLKGYNLNKYALRVLRVGLNADKDDAHGRWISRAEFSTGLPILGATNEKEDGANGSAKFFKINTNLTRVQALPFKTTGIFKASAQFTPDGLLSPEQMQIGGMYTVRGYDEGSLLGDYGYTASLELRTPISFLPNNLIVPFMPAASKFKNIALRDRIQLAAFYDQGFVKTVHPLSAENSPNFLQSVGVGLRCYLTKYVMANVDFGIPLGRDKSTNQNFMKVHFGLSSSLF